MGQGLRFELAESLRAGGTASDLAEAMYDVIGHTPDVADRRFILSVMAGALIMHTNRASLAALLRGRFGDFVRLARLDRVLTGFNADLLHSDADPGADMIRVSLLRLRLGGAGPESHVLRAAGAAMAAVAAGRTVS